MMADVEQSAGSDLDCVAGASQGQDNTEENAATTLTITSQQA